MTHFKRLSWCLFIKKLCDPQLVFKIPIENSLLKMFAEKFIKKVRKTRPSRSRTLKILLRTPKFAASQIASQANSDRL